MRSRSPSSLHSGITFLFLLLLCGAQAAPERQTAQVPGYFRYAVGAFTVTALYDGTADVPLSLLHGTSTAKMQALVARAFMTKATGVPTDVNAFLIDTGIHRVLVDAGTAQCFGVNPNLGLLPGNLRAAGYSPDDIDIVLITHLHSDHFCGLRGAEGQRLYPKAAVWVAEEDAAYWLDEKIAAAQPENIRYAFKQAREVMGLYRDAGVLHTFKANDTILPGMRIVATHGHTPGHTAFLFESEGRSLLVFGDIVHSMPVQFSLPFVSFDSDSDPKAAVAAREKLFTQLAKDGTAFAGAHLPFPGIGHIGKDGEAYRWVPVAYGPLLQ